jgi:serine/threonine protein kinase
MTVAYEYALAIIVNNQTRPACTPAAVCAPELLFERLTRPVDPGPPPTRASDIWSLACIIYELMFGTRLFHYAVQNSLLGKMAMLCGEVPPEWKGYWDSRERLRSLCE